MTNQFHLFAKAVHGRLVDLARSELYVTEPIDIFESYLAAFPEGTNPIFRERTEHDCSCCKQFIRTFGRVVAIADGEVLTVWDNHAALPHPYDAVAQHMAKLIRQQPIAGVFRTKERSYGAETSRELLDDMTTRTWHHFHGHVENRHYSAKPDEVRGEIATAAQVYRRGLEELNGDAIASVLDLIDSNALYRGAEFRGAVVAFRDLQRAYKVAENRDTFVWETVGNPASRFRNTVIGTLVQDLSEGVDIERAVRGFESKVAPTNYKRPTAIITQRMVDDAARTLSDLGLESALERRFARLADVSVNNVLFVDNAARGQMKDGIAALLAADVKAPAVDFKHAEEIGVEEFFTHVVPQASSIDLLVENRHLGNFMSLTAPVHPDAARLFRWDNGFAWSYDGDVADSIKQRVKRAGGNVDAKLRVSLAWFNTDDLDIHAQAPEGHIYFGNKSGVLDVDMNVTSTVRDPVENLSWTHPRDGAYNIVINQYTKRESQDVGFVLEFEGFGRSEQFRYERAVSGNVDALRFTIRGGALAEFKPAPVLVGGSVSTTKWGVSTETLVPVDTLMASPNHWDGQGVGNKHWFFLLKGCRSPEAARGIYNEFLSPALEKHRKVFEVLGARTKCPPSDEQLSGIGFSSTRGDKATVVVKGNRLNKAYTIVF